MEKETRTESFSYEPFRVPDGVEAAAHRFAAECLVNGFMGFASVGVVDGVVQSITAEKDGSLHVVYLINGEWCELIETTEGKREDG